MPRALGFPAEPLQPCSVGDGCGSSGPATGVAPQFAWALSLKGVYPLCPAELRAAPMSPARRSAQPASSRQSTMAMQSSGLNLLVTSVATLAVWAATGLPEFGALVFAAGLLIGLWASWFGWRPTILSLAILAVPPGLLGENSARFAIVGLITIAIVLATSARGAITRTGTFALLAGLLVVEGIAFVLGSIISPGSDLQLPWIMLLLYWLTAAALMLGCGRTTLVAGTIRSLAWMVAALSASYLVSLAIGFRGGPIELRLTYRQVELFPPVTLTAGSGGYFPSIPRLTVFAGEPGLGVVFMLVAAWAAVRLEHGSRRVALLGLVLAGVVLTQSTGSVLALAAMAIGGVLAGITQRYSAWIAAVLAILAIPIAQLLGTTLIGIKQETNPLSISDRGLGDLLGAGGDNSTKGSISLLAAASNSPMIAVPIVVLLLVMLILSLRDSASLGLVLGISVSALFAQPLQLHPGVWLIVGFAVLISGDVPRRTSTRLHSDVKGNERRLPGARRKSSLSPR